MIFEIVRFLLDVASGLLCGAFLLRLYMQYQRTPFGNPVGRFVFALTDWAVLPLRKLLPSIRRIDTASLVAAYLVQVLRFVILWLMAGWAAGAAVLPIVAFFALLKLAITGLMALVIVNAILSWVRADSPIVDVIERLCAPLLRPFRRIIPLVGGIDLSPLALIVVLQIVAIVLDGLQNAVLR